MGWFIPVVLFIGVKLLFLCVVIKLIQQQKVKVMKGKYITTQILLACKAKPVVTAGRLTFKELKAMPDELKKITASKRLVPSFELAAA